MRHIVGRHKKELLQLGDDVALLKQANSDIPFFALKLITPPQVEGDATIEKELWHLYPAMGLPGQHEWQQSLLARCKDFHAAACILQAIAEVLGLCVYSDMVTHVLDAKTADDSQFSFIDTLLKVGVPFGEILLHKHFLLKVVTSVLTTPLLPRRHGFTRTTRSPVIVNQ